MKHSVAIYPGSFDPPTLGHLNIVERGLKIFDKILIAVAVNPAKKSLFTPEERVALLKKIYRNRKNVAVDHFHGLLAGYAQETKIPRILRGLRTVADYEYELQMAFTNKTLSPELETIFLMTENRFSHISSTLIKEIAYFGGSCSNMVLPAVEREIQKKLKIRSLQEA